MRKLQLVLLLGVALSGRRTASIAQSSPLVPPEWFRAIRGESSGELPFADFRNIHAQFSGFAFAVGTALTGGPPHRSQRALLTHWAPTSGHDAQSLFGVRGAKYE